MKSFLLVVAGFAVGGIATFLLTSGLLTGIGAGAGIVTGMKAGACLTIEAAKKQGLVTEDQVDALLTAAAGEISSTAPQDEPLFSGGSAACEKFVAELREAAAQRE